MRVIIGLLLLMTIYYGTLKLLNIRYLWTHQLLGSIGVVVIIYLLMVIHRQITRLRMSKPLNVTMTMTIRHQVIRIPLEDQVDFDVDDGHNVHNTTVKRCSLEAIQALKKQDSGEWTVASMFEKLIPLLNYKATHALKQMRMLNAYYSAGKINELEMLRLVWDRIQAPINQKNRDLLVDNLIEQLADCRHEDGSLHCCEGRITRILQTLELLDAEDIVKLRPMWAFRDEIENKIGIYRDKLLHKAPDIYRKIDQKLKLDKQDKVYLNRFNRCLIRNLNKRFEKDYLITGTLKADELEDITTVYYKSLFENL